MSLRYLLIAGAGRPGVRALAARLAARTGLGLSFSSRDIAALCSPACRCIPLGEKGCIVGALFHRHGRAIAIDSLTEAESRAILESNLDRLLCKFWGGYVGAACNRDSVSILRDPSAALPCYYATKGGYDAFASDADLLVEGGFADVDLDADALARHFVAAGVPAPQTAISGVSELLAGFAIRRPGTTGCQESRWSPWDFVESGGAEPDAELVARTVRHSVASWSAGFERLLVSVSGGLDSSIVAAALAEARRDAICLTMYGTDPHGDERPFARALCGHLGLQLLEREYRLDDIDIRAALGAHLPRPSDRSHALAYEQAHLDVAGEIGATAFVTGNGGDSVFAYSQSAAAAADRWLSEGIGTGFARTLRDISVQTGCGIVRAGTSAFRIAQGPRGYRCRPDRLFLDTGRMRALGRPVFDHPWLRAPANALPGKSAHIASILRVQQCLEPSRARSLPILNPLMSQPLVELCLAVPSWKWREGGRDRSLARRAFAGALPPTILSRRVKGGPDGFAAQVLERFRDPIRERLLDGWLARNAVVDRTALEEKLSPERPVAGEERARILEFVAAEAWIDSWLSRAARGSVSHSAAQRLPSEGTF